MISLKHNFRELKIWRNSMDLVVEIYAISNNLPEAEKFGLVSQICRSSVSIPSNIAEGSARGGEKQFQHFLDIAISSSCELETQLILISEIYKVKVDDLIIKINELQKMIIGFKRTLRQS